MTLTEGNRKLTEAKQSFDLALQFFASGFVGFNPEQRDVEFNKVVLEYSRLLTCLNAVIIEVHNEVDLYVDTGARANLLATTKNFLVSTDQYWLMSKTAQAQKIPEVVKSPHAYDTVQFLLNSFPEQPYLNDQQKKFTGEGVSLHNKVLRRTGEEDNVRIARIKLSIIVGAASVGGVVVIFLTRTSLDAQFAGILQALFAVGCAGLSAAIIGAISVSLRISPWMISAAGGFAVFVVIYFFEPVRSYDRFEIWLSIRDSLDNTIKLATVPALDVEGPEKPSLQVNDLYYFNDISSEYSNKERDFIIDNGDQMVFAKNNKRRLKVKLKRGDMSLTVKRDPELVKIERGDSLIIFTRTLVYHGSGTPLQFAWVSVIHAADSQKVRTDINGTFSLQINKNVHKDGRLKLHVEKGKKSHDFELALYSEVVSSIPILLTSN